MKNILLTITVVLLSFQTHAAERSLATDECTGLLITPTQSVVAYLGSLVEQQIIGDVEIYKSKLLYGL